MDCQGSIVAIVTPVKDNKIDMPAYEKLIEFQIKNRTSAILTCGCTGEPATMSMDEHKAMIDVTVELVKGRIPVIAGTGSNNTKEAIELSSYAEKAGADAVLLITPYYNKPVPKGQYLHYKTVANNIGIPVIIYNVPSRTGISMLPETIFELSKVNNIVAIKEASGNVDQSSQIIALCRHSGFSVLSGDDSLTLPIMSVGGRGIISVAANIVPLQMSEMVTAALENNWEKARNIHMDLLPVFRMLFIETNPIPVKASLALMGMISPEWRLPLTPPSEENLEKIRAILKQGGII